MVVKGRPVTILFILLFITTSGCASLPCRTHPELEARSKTIKTLGLLSPNVVIYSFSFKHVTVPEDDWSAEGSENIQKALTEFFKKTPFGIKSITVDKGLEKEMEDVFALYEAVSLSIQLHTYGGFKFPEEMTNFQYSIGPIHDILERYDADALLFIEAVDEVSTTGRKAMKVGMILALPVTKSPFLPRAGVTTLSAAFVDSEGTILWYNMKSSKGGFNLRKPGSAARLIHHVFSSFPGLNK